ncbi:glycosyl transferase family 2 [Shimia isoporae]|uniref:Glycosyl transferase family 2 n=1 Tax=Shimia isoporae TaxID=647720 RepID=A0A4R1N384_9RHOB|nr:glycosyltransferase family 2 protein [Shimia isoporae]TCL00708.1 glycosyl transferase family 2 [Shimia isoporae]
MRILSVTSVRNEGPYLLEWIAHHKAAGVSDFLIYSNDCDDGTHELLNALAAEGVVTHVPHVPEKAKSIQWQALRAAWKHPLRKEADWILVSDVDEFINIHAKGHTIPDLIERLPKDADAIVLPWRLFGNNGVSGIDALPVTEQFTRAIPADAQYPIAASLFKMLFRAKGPFNQFGVHRPKQKPRDKARLPKIFNGSGEAMHPFLADHPQRLSLWQLGVARDLVELNHYAIRSAAGFIVKRDRGLPNRATKKVDLAYWVERNFNTIEDCSISNMSAATKAATEELMRLPDVEELHVKALKWHRARFEELIKQPENQELMSQVLCAGSSEVPSPQLQKMLVRWYQVANKENS